MEGLSRMLPLTHREGSVPPGLNSWTYWLKLLTRDPIRRVQPSTTTNNRILNGAEIITGGNWTIPTDRLTEATTISMMRNGRKSTAPIWNPALSSERMYAGARIERARSFGAAGAGVLLISRNSWISFSRVKWRRN